MARIEAGWPQRAHASAEAWRGFMAATTIMPWPTWLMPIAPVENLQAALTLAGNHDLGVSIAELDLTYRPASGVKLAENDSRAVPGASRRPAGT
jgi:hypothetical protein